MSEPHETIVLPSGRVAHIRMGHGRDLMRARRNSAIADKADETTAAGFALIAELTKIDGATIIYEDVLDMPLDDVLELQLHVLGKNAQRSATS
ncbi:MAG: hypothetical protein IVW56_04580 [Candidatus Binataceae bacterium]|nr:hypothetical protein [Candidatus Binataceae bacterium]